MVECCIVVIVCDGFVVFFDCYFVGGEIECVWIDVCIVEYVYIV